MTSNCIIKINKQSWKSWKQFCQWSVFKDMNYNVKKQAWPSSWKSCGRNVGQTLTWYMKNKLTLLYIHSIKIIRTIIFLEQHYKLLSCSTHGGVLRIKKLLREFSSVLTYSWDFEILERDPKDQFLKLVQRK